MKKVLYITNVPAPYTVDFFRELTKYVDLTVIFEMQQCKTRDNKWYNVQDQPYKQINLDAKEISEGIGYSRKVKKYITKDYDLIVLGGYASPVDQFARRKAVRKKIKFLINSDGCFMYKEPFFKKLLKKWFIKGASGILTTCNQAVEKFKYLGVKEDNIYLYPFSSIKNENIREKTSLNVRKNSRKRIISVGRFIDWKGMDDILSICHLLKECDFYFVGGKPTPEYLKIVNDNSLENVKFIDFVVKNDLITLYDESDVFVLMTRDDIWGLVINEAMARGLPIITTNKCNAGLELIKNGENGFIIDTNDREALVNKLKLLINDDSLREKMANNNIDRIHDYTIEKMAEKHNDIFDLVLKK